MSLKPLIQTENYARKEACAKGHTVVECRFSQSSEIAEIIAVHPSVNLTQCELSSGRATYGGRLICTVVYVDEEGKLCRMQKGAEFSHYLDGEIFKSDRIAQCALFAEKTQLKRDGSSFVISAVITAQITVFATVKRNYVCDIEGAVCNGRQQKFTSAVAFSGESEVEDEFEADGVSDVLLPSAQAIITECIAGGGEVKISGEICLSLLAVRGNSPVSLDRIIPFKSVLVCDRAQLNLDACCSVQVKDLSVNATVNEDRGKCQIDVNCTLCFNGTFYEEQQTTVLQDAFSTTHEIALSNESENVCGCAQTKTLSQRISAPVVTSAKIDYTCSFKAVSCSRVDYEYDGGKLQGVVYVVLIYEQNGEIKSCNLELPFAETINLFDGDNIGEIELSVAVCGVSVRQQTEGGCIAEGVLKISACATYQRETQFITEVVEGAEYAPNDSAITVYVAKTGDTLWDVAKKLRKAPVEVEGENPEMKFPLQNEERILVYRAKTY